MREGYLAVAVRSATSAVEGAEPLLTALGGGAGVGSVLGVAWAMHKGYSQWERSAAYGSVGGALVGAALLLVDIGQNV